MVFRLECRYFRVNGNLHTHKNTKMGTNVWGGPAVLTVTWAAMMAMEDVMNGNNENGEGEGWGITESGGLVNVSSTS